MSIRHWLIVLAVIVYALLPRPSRAQDCAALFPDKQPQCPERVRGGCYRCWSQQYKSCAPISPPETCNGGSVPCTRTGKPDGPTLQYPASWIPQKEIRRRDASGQAISIEWTCEANEVPIRSPLLWTATSAWTPDPATPTPPIQLLPEASNENRVPRSPRDPLPIERIAGQ